MDTRLAYADYLAHMGLNTYLYCPKADPWLRRRWQDEWPAAQWDQLLQVGKRYRAAGINWGVGLSPFELYRDYGRVQRAQFRNKLERIAQLQAPLLAILFDDMPGDLDALASRQAEIVADTRHWLPGVRLLVCPTYYSFDPVLEKLFGPMPADYWPQLGRDLPQSAQVFWTGNRVCPATVAVRDIEAIRRQLGRPVVLWDNYPVNDGAVRSNFLYLEELSQRDPQLRGLLDGHLCNAMNQGLLSLPALAGLAALYGGGSCSDQWFGEVLGAQTWAQLRSDRDLFQREGLGALQDSDRRRQLAQVYARLPGAAAREVAGWLAGEYTFDPACLTD
ncbi:MAG: beta-N-acetylglucosaminidase domain-containing protein [Halioglobus sp.]|nr:beta-N-acetylglucosaminidase domain-containing protein [Halioglobus sp.]